VGVDERRPVCHIEKRLQGCGLLTSAADGYNKPSLNSSPLSPLTATSYNDTYYLK